MSTLVLSPHADDAVIGASRAILESPRPRVLLSITDDALGCEGGKEAAAQRQARMLDLVAKRYGFQIVERLSIPEMRSHFHARRIASAIVSAVERHGVDAVYVPAYQGGHVDHDATAIAARWALELADVPFFEYALYHRVGGDFVHNRFPDGTQAAELPPGVASVRRGVLSELAADLPDSAHFLDDRCESVRALTSRQLPDIPLPALLQDKTGCTPAQLAGIALGGLQ